MSQSEPEPVTAARISSAASAASSSGPGSLIFVVVPSGSTTVMLLRMDPRIRTACDITPVAASAASKTAKSSSLAGNTARAGCSLTARARATLTPLPAHSTRTSDARCTPPGSSALTRSVRSKLGFGVSVVITNPRRPHGSR